MLVSSLKKVPRMPIEGFCNGVANFAWCVRCVGDQLLLCGLEVSNLWLNRPLRIWYCEYYRRYVTLGLHDVSLTILVRVHSPGVFYFRDIPSSSRLCYFLVVLSRLLSVSV
jgi:hypothetical protein